MFFLFHARTGKRTLSKLLAHMEGVGAAFDNSSTFISGISNPLLPHLLLLFSGCIVESSTWNRMSKFELPSTSGDTLRYCQWIPSSLVEGVAVIALHNHQKSSPVESKFT